MALWTFHFIMPKFNLYAKRIPMSKTSCQNNIVIISCAQEKWQSSKDVVRSAAKFSIMLSSFHPLLISWHVIFYKDKEGKHPHNVYEMELFTDEEEVNSLRVDPFLSSHQCGTTAGFENEEKKNCENGKYCASLIIYLLIFTFPFSTGVLNNKEGNGKVSLRGIPRHRIRPLGMFSVTKFRKLATTEWVLSWFKQMKILARSPFWCSARRAKTKATKYWNSIQIIISWAAEKKFNRNGEIPRVLMIRVYRCEYWISIFIRLLERRPVTLW